MKNFLLTITLLLACIAANAQISNYTIAGQITNVQQPIPVIFTAFDPTMGTVTSQVRTMTDSVGNLGVVIVVNSPAMGLPPIVNMDFTDCTGANSTVSVNIDPALQIGTFTANFCSIIVVPTCSASYYYTNNNPFATPYSIAFHNLSQLSGAGSYFIWDYGDGTTDTTTQMLTVHNFSGPGMYNVCLFALDTANNCSTYFCNPVLLSPVGQNCAARWWGGVDPLNNMTADLNNASSASNTATFTWTFGDGDTLISNQANITHLYRNPGFYQICLTMTDSFCTNTYCDYLNVGFSSPVCQPNFNYSVATAISPFSVDFTNLSWGGDSTTVYTWHFDTVTLVSNSPVLTYNFGTWGVYNVCLTMSSATCYNSFCMAVNITQPGSVCQPYFFHNPVAGQSFNTTFYNFSFPMSSTATYSWDFGDGSFSNSNALMFDHNYQVAGFYNVCLTVTDSNCSQTYCENFEVGNLQAGTCLAGIGWYQADPYNNPKTVNFVNNSVNFDVNTAVFNWNFGDGTTSTDLNPVHTYPDTGNYVVTLTMNYNGCTDTRIDPIYVQTWGSGCQASFSVTQDTTTGLVQIVNNTQGTNIFYIWDFGDGYVTTDTFPVHNYAGPGTYSLCLTTFNLNQGCSSYYCDTITIDSSGLLMRGGRRFVVRVVPPQTVNSPVLGIGNPAQANDAFRVSPNPASDFLNISSDKSSGQAQFTVLNLTGQTVLQTSLNTNGQNKYVLDISSLSGGMYLLQINSDRQTQAIKFVKQ